MGAYEYVALDRAGKQTKGVLEGDTPKHVRQQLRDRRDQRELLLLHLIRPPNSLRE